MHIRDRKRKRNLTRLYHQIDAINYNACCLSPKENNRNYILELKLEVETPRDRYEAPSSLMFRFQRDSSKTPKKDLRGCKTCRSLFGFLKGVQNSLTVSFFSKSIAK